MSWETMTRVCLATGTLLLMLLPSTSFAQPECDDARKSCLDYCHYAPENQWSSGFKCKRECTKQLEACRRGIRGYPSRYGYGGQPGYSAYGTQTPYPSGGYPAPPRGGYGVPAREEPYTGP